MPVSTEMVAAQHGPGRSAEARVEGLLRDLCRWDLGSDDSVTVFGSYFYLNKRERERKKRYGFGWVGKWERSGRIL